MSYQKFDKVEGAYVPLETLLTWLREHPLLVTGKNGEIIRRRVVPLCIWGSRGVGKTAQIQSYCEAHGLELRTYHPAHDQSGGDIVGEKHLDPINGRTIYALPHWLPTEDDPPGILFMDEINRATKPVLHGLMEPLGEGTISQSGWKLPEHWQIVAAANPGEQGYDVEIMDDAMVDRLLHYVPGWDAPAWTAWALTMGNMPEAVVDFALSNKEYISIGETQFPMEVNERLDATPRSLTYLGALYDPRMPESLLATIAKGLLGRDVGPMFVQWHHNHDARPLGYDKLLEGQFLQEVSLWKQERREDLFTGTTLRMIAGLVGKDPDPKIAGELGKFVALLPGHVRQELWVDMDRSAPAWLPLMRQAADHWQRQLSSSQIA